MRLNPAHTALRTINRVNPNNPIGSYISVENNILTGVLGEGLDFNPEAARHDLFKAAYLIGASYDSFTNQCSRTTENKKANKKTHDLARPAQIAAA